MSIIGRTRRSGRLAPVLLAAAMGVGGCSLYHYHPATEVGVEALAAKGCDNGDRVITRAELNQVYEDALVLWDGRDADSTVTVEFKGPGVARKTKSLVGQNRYERAYDALVEQRSHQRPVEVTMVCRGDHKTPTATRISFRDDGGDEVAFDF